MTPTQRTLVECRKRGWLACVVEKWIPHTHKRLDVFGFGDVLALDGKPGALLIQATTTDNAPARVHKVWQECAHEAKRWLEAGNRIQVWGWAKRGARGKRKLWTLRATEVT